MVSSSTLRFLLLSVALVLAQSATARPNGPLAFFVFGDSLVDNGNNNYLLTIARADRRPCGIDYPTRLPTGCFSNGFNIHDLISQLIGSESVLPYLSPALTGEKLFVGANFAFAGVGILNDTGIQNDFVNNYYLVPYSARSGQYPDVADYVKYLITKYRKILHKLYGLGARRVLVTGSGAMGCCPTERAQRGKNGRCAAELQRAASLYNPQLNQMVKELNIKLGGDIFIAANTNKMHNDFIHNPKAYGFETSKVACCGQGRYNGIGLCTPLSNLCPNRNLYAFWDAFHPTEKANRIIVKEIMSGETYYMSPMNLSSLLALDYART